MYFRKVGDRYINFNAVRDMVVCKGAYGGETLYIRFKHGPDKEITMTDNVRRILDELCQNNLSPMEKK